jgi:hypothetical protein
MEARQRRRCRSSCERVEIGKGAARVDINGAKALKKRLGQKGADEAPPTSVEVSEDSPPVYHWLGIRQSAPETLAEIDHGTRSASLFRRLGLS